MYKETPRTFELFGEGAQEVYLSCLSYAVASDGRRSDPTVAWSENRCVSH